MEILGYLKVSLKTVEAQITKVFGILSTKLGMRYEMILFMVFSIEIKGFAK